MKVMLNGAALFMGLPGLAGERHGLFDPNADQGLGFHQDGTARRADGTTGNQAGSSNYTGRRAAAFLNHGMGYSDGFGYGQSLRLPASSEEPSEFTHDYDPVTGHAYSSGSARNARQGSTFGGAFISDPQQYFMQRGLNYSMGWLNSMGEAGFAGLTDNGRARLNFLMDQYGRLNGEGDVLFPFYDGTYTTLFTQVGARSMSSFGDNSGDGRGADRWIGNFGLGQRWFPGAFSTENGSVDSGEWMLGYNVFFDNDFTRGHQRGGIGAEIQYDWLKLASNYYLPLSDWKGSRDFDNDFVEERPAQGWDVRLKGYLPFYRNVAATGAYSQWYGDNVSMYSTSKLEKDPHVWSYGLEYTPIPLVSAFINQRSTGRGNNDTEFGLRFTYHFDMPWDQQTSHAKVAETRTVAAARHDFVDRENRIILEYRAKDSYHIEYLGPDGSRGFRFLIKDGFGKYKAGQTVRVTASGNYLAETAKAAPATFFAQATDWLDDFISVKRAHAGDLSKTYITDSQGHFWVQLDASAPAVTSVTVQTGNTSKNFTLQGSGAVSFTGLSLQIAYNRSSFVTSDFSATATVTATASDNGNPLAINAGDITWTVLSSSISTSWWGNRAAGATNGLTWGATPLSLNGTDPQRMTVAGATPNGNTAQLTDVVGSRTVQLKAEMVINSQPYSQVVTVAFGSGPLSVFKDKPFGPGNNWEDAGAYCGSAGNINQSGYQAATRLPTFDQLKNVAGSGNGGKQGAAHAAGWPDEGASSFRYWVGEAAGNGGNAHVVYLNTGNSGLTIGANTFAVTVCLP